eukprot:m.4581 g.4581  ORF g.4581 m.4581 type:complete len:707 (-) comp3023_c0_seq1:61-2181(-)
MGANDSREMRTKHYMGKQTTDWTEETLKKESCNTGDFILRRSDRLNCLVIALKTGPNTVRHFPINETVLPMGVQYCFEPEWIVGTSRMNPKDYNAKVKKVFSVKYTTVEGLVRAFATTGPHARSSTGHFSCRLTRCLTREEVGFGKVRTMSFSGNLVRTPSGRGMGLSMKLRGQRPGNPNDDVGSLPGHALTPRLRANSAASALRLSYEDNVIKRQGSNGEHNPDDHVYETSPLPFLQAKGGSLNAASPKKSSQEIVKKKKKKKKKKPKKEVTEQTDEESEEVDLENFGMATSEDDLDGDEVEEEKKSERRLSDEIVWEGDPDDDDEDDNDNSNDAKEALKTEIPEISTEVELEVSVRREDGKLGCVFVGPKQIGDGLIGVYISKVKPGSPAEKESGLVPGMRVLEIAGQDVRKVTKATVSFVLQDTPGESLLLKVLLDPKGFAQYDKGVLLHEYEMAKNARVDTLSKDDYYKFQDLLGKGIAKPEVWNEYETSAQAQSGNAGVGTGNDEDFYQMGEQMAAAATNSELQEEPSPLIAQEEETATSSVFQTQERVFIAEYGMGTVRYVGEHHKNKGPIIGIELDEPNGLNDGSIDGHSYFKCAWAKGVIVPPSKVSKVVALNEEDAKASEKQVPTDLYFAMSPKKDEEEEAAYGVVRDFKSANEAGKVVHVTMGVPLEEKRVSILSEFGFSSEGQDNDGEDSDTFGF